MDKIFFCCKIVLNTIKKLFLTTLLSLSVRSWLLLHTHACRVDSAEIFAEICDQRKLKSAAEVHLTIVKKRLKIHLT